MKVMLFCRCGRALKIVLTEYRTKVAETPIFVCSGSLQSREDCTLDKIPLDEHFRIRKEIKERYNA